MALTIGDKAPAFSAKDQDGKTIQLSDFTGKNLVLYFYPKDNTPGCTKESCNLRDNYKALLAQGYEVLGVSVDDEKSHQKFIQKFDLPFSLLADTDHKVVSDYRVWREKKNYGKTYMGIVRTTFIINGEGVISEIIEKVNTENHTEQILK